MSMSVVESKSAPIPMAVIAAMTTSASIRAKPSLSFIMPFIFISLPLRHGLVYRAGGCALFRRRACVYRPYPVRIHIVFEFPVIDVERYGGCACRNNSCPVIIRLPVLNERAAVRYHPLFKVVAPEVIGWEGWGRGACGHAGKGSDICGNRVPADFYAEIAGCVDYPEIRWRGRRCIAGIGGYGYRYGGRRDSKYIGNINPVRIGIGGARAGHGVYINVCPCPGKPCCNGCYKQTGINRGFRNFGRMDIGCPSRGICE